MNGSALIESILSVDQTGIVCSDAQGLPLSIKSNDKSVLVDRVGVYSNMAKLASKLQESASKDSGEDAPKPLITIETDTSVILVKEYAGHTVGIQLPRSKVAPNNKDTEP